MLLAAGPGLAALKDYTLLTMTPTDITASSAQGDTLDTLGATLRDRTNTATLAAEDDIVWLEERDPNGWPTVNLLANPNLGGTYSGGLAPNWFLYTPTLTAGTATPASSTDGPLNLGTSQQLTCSNLAQASGSGYAQIYQTITLPLDETATPLRAQPYCFSVYYKVTTAFTGADFRICVDWKDYNNTYLSTVSTLIASNPGLTGWYRAYLLVTAPSTAFHASVYLQYSATSTTNAGAFRFSAAQLEYATFARVPVPLTLGLALANPNFTGTDGASGAAPSWYTDGSDAATAYTLVDTPAIGATAQQIVVTNDSASGTTRAIAQNIKLSGFSAGALDLGEYQVAVTYQILGTLSANAKIRLGINYQDINGNFLANASTDSAVGLSGNNLWQRMTLAFGPGTAHIPPTSGASYSLKIYCGLIDTVDATWSGTLVIGALTISTLYGTPDSASAQAAGVYPTPYCDSTQAGCYTDKRANLYYRHLRRFGGFVKQVDYHQDKSVERDLVVQAVEYGTLLQEAGITLAVNNEWDTTAIAAAATYATNQGYLAGLDTTTYVTTVGSIDSQTFAMSTMRDFMNYIANQTTGVYYVDYYMRLHYGPALANAVSFGLSDAPDGSTTYPYTDFIYSSDSTQSATEEVVEGGDATSAAQTYSATGQNVTTTATLSSGTAYTALPVTATPVAIPQGTQLTLGSQTLTVSSAVAQSATSIPVNSFTASTTYASGTAIGVTTSFTVNNNNAINGVSSVTVAGTGQKVGLAPNDALAAGGYTAVYNPAGGTVQLLTAVGSSTTVNVVYTYAAPVLVRVHASSASGAGGSIGRKIFTHVKLDKLTSKKAAIDRGNADVSQYKKARPVIQCNVWSPMAPATSVLRAGMAIALTNRIQGVTNTLFQIQQVDTITRGNGVIIYALKLGYYRPDIIIHMAQIVRASTTAGSNISGSTILSDVLTVSDGWAVTDKATAAVGNIGKWGGTTSTTWGGTMVWG